MDNTTNARQVITTTTRDFILDVSRIENTSPGTTTEVLGVATNAIFGVFELLTIWSNQGDRRTFGISAERNFIVDPPGKTIGTPYHSMSIYVHLWPFGCNYTDGQPPKCRSIAAFYQNNNFINHELWNALVNDVLVAIKGAEELITEANKKED